LKRKKISIYITNPIKISYLRATTVAPIKATKIIIEISSNGRKNSVGKRIPICWLVLIKSRSIIWFGLVVQIILYHEVSQIIVISETKILAQTIKVI